MTSNAAGSGRSKPSLFERMLEPAKDAGLQPFFHVPLQQFVRSQLEAEWVLTSTEKQVRHGSQLFNYLHRRFGKEGNTKNNTVLLSDALMAWLSSPAKGDYPLPITNFLWLTLNFVNSFDRLYDIKTVRGIHDYYLDLAGKYYIGMELPARLMPDAVFDYLAEPYPCAQPPQPALPLSRGMAHLWREFIPDIPFKPEDATSRAHFFMRFLVFAQVTEIDPRIFSKATIDYLNAPLFPSEQNGVGATGLMFEVFRLAGLAEDAGWKTPSFVTDKVMRFTGSAMKTLMLPQAVAEHHQALARNLGAADVVTILPAGKKAQKKYILSDEPAATMDVNKAHINLFETGDAYAPFNPITRQLGQALDAAKVLRTYILPEYDPYPAIIKNNKLENQPWAPINLIAMGLDKAADTMLAQGLRYHNNRLNIGYCTWETNQLPKLHQLGLPLLDEIWVPTEYVKKIISAATDIPVHVMPYPISLAKPASYLTRKLLDIPEDAFVFLTSLDCMDWMSRKNPMATVKAFQKAFGPRDNVRLIIKSRNIDKPEAPTEFTHLRYIQEMSQKDTRLVLIHRDYTDAEMVALMGLSNCYVSLHRNSAYGRAMMEAMLAGKPVIMTNATGPLDYANASNAALVNATECSVIYDVYQNLEHERGHRWFDADPVHAAELMQRIIKDKTYAQSIAKAGQACIAAQYNPDATGTKMKARIGELLASLSGKAA